MVIKMSNWLAAGLLGSVLILSPIATAAEKSDMMKDEKAGTMKDEAGKMMKGAKSEMKKEKAGMMKDSKAMMKDQMKEMKAKKTDDTMKMNKMEEKK